MPLSCKSRMLNIAQYPPYPYHLRLVITPTVILQCEQDDVKMTLVPVPLQKILFDDILADCTGSSTLHSSLILILIRNAQLLEKLVGGEDIQDTLGKSPRKDGAEWLVKNVKFTEVVMCFSSPRWCSLLRRMLYRSRPLRGLQSFCW